MTEDTKDIPQSDEVQVDVEKAVKDFCVEMSASMIRSEAERDFRKEATSRMSEKTGISKDVLNFCARTYHKQDFDTKTQRAKDQMDFYTQIFGEPAGNNDGEHDDNFDD